MSRETKLEKLTENAKEVLANSFNLARETRASEVMVEHVFIALLSLDKGLAARFLRSLGIDLSKTVKSIKDRIPPSKDKVAEITISDEVKEIVKSAFLLSHELGHVYVGTEHILLAILKNKNRDFVKELEIAGLDFKSMKRKLLAYGTYAPGVFVKESPSEKGEGEAINYFGRNLNLLAKKGKLMPIIGRTKETDRLIRILARHTKNNPILVGEAGVGKTAVVEGLVQRITRGDVPESMKNLEIYQIDIASIIAGSKVRGDVEQRLLVLVSEVASSPNKVLFIDEIHMIVGAGAAGPDRTMDIANILKPRLTDGSIRVIGATTTSEYRQYFEEDAALSRRFQPVYVDEITVDDAAKILKGIRGRLEEYHGVRISDEAIAASIKLSDRYISDRFLPDKAIDVLDEAAAAEKLRQEADYAGYNKIKQKLVTLETKKKKALKEHMFDKALDFRKEEKLLEDDIQIVSDKQKRRIQQGEFNVTSEDVKKVVSEWTNIPVTTLSIGERRALRGLTRRVAKRIIGQSEAVKRVTATLKRSRLGISDERRPLASFLFLGPTGVGKTEMARVVAHEFLGSEKALIQVDMSEYMEQHSVAKIIGAPPGYVGFQEGGQLTEDIRKRPYSVVLFDEIEKAHPDLLNILLQILEEGQITDSRGRKVNFKNTIIILTSNIGAEDIGRDKVLGFKVQSEEKEKDEAYERMRERLTEKLKRALRPEFINRIDDVVIFRGLDENDAQKITKLLLKEVSERLEDQGVGVKVEESVIKRIAKDGFSDEYGARNLRRKIQELIENQLSDLILESKKPVKKVLVKSDKGKIQFTPYDD
ncbi:ATP-dependent Clp protease ATP-binding subunit [Candidatus Dojkabacteria bacterium]|nr:ATP-dependent Clp protease ATP-binding subunit [Candidatus Dojkabacteria bacterium]